MNETHKDRAIHPVTKVVDLPLREYLAMRIRRYEVNTGRTDGLAVIRDVLAAYRVERFSHLPMEKQLEALKAITAIYDGTP